jgi:UDPglucose 6-dehydrogenase
VIKYDKYQNLNSFEELSSCKFIFISVPTPFDCKSDLVDLSAINESLKKLSKLKYKGIVIIKSTIPPKTTDIYLESYNFNIIFNPEFLRESTTPNEDFENQDIVVIGTSSKSVFTDVKEMFSNVLVPHAKYYHTSTREAEMIKTAQNTMLASRVALANMIYDACERNNVDYQKVRQIAFDNFEILGPHMTQVPGPDGNRGFGGKCLPKDIRAFSTVYSSDLLNSIINYNDSLRDDLDDFLMNYKD